MTLGITPEYSQLDWDEANVASTSLTLLHLHMETDQDALFAHHLIDRNRTTLDSLTLNHDEYSAIRDTLSAIPVRLRHLALCDLTVESTTFELDIKLPQMINLISLQLTNNGYKNFAFLSSLPLLRSLELRYYFALDEGQIDSAIFGRWMLKLLDLESRLDSLRLAKLVLRGIDSRTAEAIELLPIRIRCEALGICFEVLKF